MAMFGDVKVSVRVFEYADWAPDFFAVMRPSFGMGCSVCSPEVSHIFVSENKLARLVHF